MCVCVRERERERERVCVCVCERERERERWPLASIAASIYSHDTIFVPAKGSYLRLIDLCITQL